MFRRSRSLILLLLFSLVACIGNTEPAGFARTTDLHGPFSVTSMFSGLALDIPGNVHAENRPIIQYKTKPQVSSNQTWILSRHESGSTKMKARSSDLHLSILGGWKGEGVSLVLRDFKALDSQLFDLYVRENRYLIRSRHSGKYLTVADSSRHHSTPIVQWSYRGDKTQLFKLTPLSLLGSDQEAAR